MPDIIATAKGLGAGYAAIGAVLQGARLRGDRPRLETLPPRPHRGRFAARVRGGTRRPGRRAIGRVIERVRERGKHLRDELEHALSGIPMVREVRGHGYLLGVEYVDPRDGTSFLPPEMRVAGRIDTTAFERGLIILSTQPTRDGYAGDQSLFAPPFTTSDDELTDMVARFAEVVGRVAETWIRAVQAPAGPLPVSEVRADEMPIERSSSSTKHPPHRDTSPSGSAGISERRYLQDRHRSARGRPHHLRPDRFARLGVRGVR